MHAFEATCPGAHLPRCPPGPTALPVNSYHVTAVLQAGSWGSAYRQTHPWSPEFPGWAELRPTPFLPDRGAGHTTGCSACESMCKCAAVRVLSPAATSRLQPLGTFPEFAKPQPSTAQPPQSPESAEGGGPFHNKSPTHFGQQKLPRARVLVLGRKESPAWPCRVQLLGWAQRRPS